MPKHQIAMKHYYHFFLWIMIFSCQQVQKTEKLEHVDTTVNAQEFDGAQDQVSPTVVHSSGDLKFIFSNIIDPYELGLYQSLEVEYKGVSQLILEDKHLELEGKSFGLNEKHVFNAKDTSFFLITANNRPDPNYYYLIKQVGETIKLIGPTKPMTKEIFGDVDNDGFLELGGFDIHCQAVSLEKLKLQDDCVDHFRVVEIKEEITRDHRSEKVIIKERI